MLRILLTSLGLLGLLATARPAAAQQVYHVELSGQPLALPTRTFFIKQVADGRPSRVPIVGTVLRGMGNVPRPADLQPSPALALQAVCDAQLPARPTDQPVLAVVRALFVQENMTFTTEQARDDLGLDFYLLDAAGQAHFALSATETVASKGMETTGRHGRQLVQALQACLTQLAATDWASAAARPGVPVADAVAGRPGDAGPAYPVLAEAGRRAGFYRTFLDFRNNTPIETPALVVESKANTHQGWGGSAVYLPYLQRPDGSAGEALRGAWGFSDGKQLFIYQRNGYYLLLRHEDGFRFLGPSGPDPQAMTTGALLGGVAGGLAASASTSNQPTDYSLDLRTGRVAPLELATVRVPAVERPTQVFVYRPRAAKGPAARLRLGAGQPVRELAAGDYLELAPVAGQPLQISLLPLTGPEMPLTVVPTSEAPTYLECQPTGAAPLRQVDATTGAAALTKIVK